MKKLTVFASGSGTNMEAIARYFQEKKEVPIEVACVITDRQDAYVQERAKALGIPSHYLTAEELRTPGYLLPLLKKYDTDAIILAGYLRLIPPFLLDAFPHKIVNIHPALLPKYGGRGMYGMKVHEAVKASGDEETGITIHLIDEEYDRGKILFQARTGLSPQDTPESIAEKVHVLEYRHFAPVIEDWLMGWDDDQ